MSAATMAVYRRALFGEKDVLFDRCLTVAAVAGALWMLVALLFPVRRVEPVTVAQLPKRIARLIVEPPKAAAPQRIVEAARPAADVVVAPQAGTPSEVLAPTAPAPAPQVRRPGRDVPAPADPNAGRLGRERAQATVAAELSGTSQALSSALDGLSTSLASGPGTGDGGGAPAGGRDRGTRGVRAARAATGAGTAGLGGTAGGGGADLGGSAIQGSRVAVGSLSGYGAGGTGGGGVDAGGGGSAAGSGGGDGGSGAAPGVHRSNASLLAVIQKYAAGIHYCYTNELKHDPALRGKLVFALTVAANGDVTEATIVENSLHSPRLTSCALSQVREWKFPPVAKGVTSFQAPFVFTPPQ